MRHPDLDLDLLRAFTAAADSGSFTAAAAIIGRTQSAVSQKILRLEEILGRRVFERTSRSLTLTGDGELLLAAARRMLDLNDSTLRDFLEPPATGSLRLGVSEDFVASQLPRLLARFNRLYPRVHLELTTGLCSDLFAAYDSGLLDVVIVKKGGPAQRGRVIWREPLVWMAAADYQVDFSRPARLALMRAPCGYREVMLNALDSVRREWTVACTASSLMGIQAAVAGGLGVTVLGRSFLKPGLQELQAPEHWPALPMAEVAVVGEESAEPGLVKPLVAFLAEGLAATI